MSCAYPSDSSEMDGDPLVTLRLLTHNARLIDTRKKQGLTQGQLALAINMTQIRLSSIETLKVIPTLEEMVKVASVFNKPIDYLFPEELLLAIKAGVFNRRKAALNTPQIISLTEAQALHLTYDGEEEMIDEVDKTFLETDIKSLVELLPYREQRVLKLTFGLESERTHTLKEIGQMMRLTPERIRQIEARALRKLRHPSRSRKLKDYL